MMLSSLPCVALVFALMIGNQEPTEQASLEVQALEELTLRYVAALGTKNEESAREAVHAQRKVVASLGTAAIQPLTESLAHEHVNVRRGAAITLLLLVEEHNIDDERLLDDALQRMIEDEDVKCRNNLYHVVHAIIANIKKQAKGDKVAPPDETQSD